METTAYLEKISAWQLPVDCGKSAKTSRRPPGIRKMPSFVSPAKVRR